MAESEKNKARQNEPIEVTAAATVGATSAASNRGGTTTTPDATSSRPARPRSRVVDPAGPTPIIEPKEEPVVKLEDIPELHYDPDKHPIPHQPWRRGETAGCEDPIDAPWRQRAEQLMKTAVKMVGGTVIDVTWYLTSVVVTIDEHFSQTVTKDLFLSPGPQIEFREAEEAMYRDPNDPNPEEIWADDEDQLVYTRDEQAEADLFKQTYARPEEGEEDIIKDLGEDVPLYMAEETRSDDAARVAEEAILKAEQAPHPVDAETLKIDTKALSTIAGAIVDSLETEEKELRVLERHEIVLSSPGAPDVLETQKQFDAHRGEVVVVETQDPWDSNRTLRGKLMDRNSMDVLLNIRGRLVTVPLNFVKCVRLPQAQQEWEGADSIMMDDREDYDQEIEEEEIYEEGDDEIDYEA